MFKIKILDKTTNKTFTKSFTSYYIYNKFVSKLKYSKKLVVLSTEKIF